MAQYRCAGFRPVEAHDAREAAEIFGNRLARRAFGKKGYCHTARVDSHSQDGRNITTEVFIGYAVGRGSTRVTSGHNEWLYLYRWDF